MRSRFGSLGRNWPARKDIVRNLAQAHRDIHSAEWPQKARRKFSRERLSLDTLGHIKNFFHLRQQTRSGISPTDRSIVMLSEAKHLCLLRCAGLVGNHQKFFASLR